MIRGLLWTAGGVTCLGVVGLSGVLGRIVMPIAALFDGDVWDTRAYTPGGI